jgi:hypothetical protein
VRLIIAGMTATVEQLLGASRARDYSGDFFRLKFVAPRAKSKSVKRAGE